MSARRGTVLRFDSPRKNDPVRKESLLSISPRWTASESLEVAEEDEIDEAAALQQHVLLHARGSHNTTHRSSATAKSAPDDLELDTDPLMPNVLTNSAAETVATLPTRVLGNVAAILVSRFRQYFDLAGTSILDPAAAPVVFHDAMRFLFSDWHFVFPLSSSVTDAATNRPSTVVPAEEGCSRAGTNPEPVLTPSSVVLALAPHLEQRNPRSLHIEGVPLGTQPDVLGHLLYRCIVANERAGKFLEKLHLPFCSLSSKSLLVLLVALQAANGTTVTELDLSHNALTHDSVPVFTLLLPTTPIRVLWLRGNRLGTAAEQVGASTEPSWLPPVPPMHLPHSPRKPLNGAGLLASPNRRRPSAQESVAVRNMLCFVRDACKSLEELDLGFTNLSSEEQEALLDLLPSLINLKGLALDGLVISPTNAAKLAVAVRKSISLHDVSVRYVMTCSSEQYQNRLHEACEARRQAMTSSLISARIPRLRGVVTDSAIVSPKHRQSPTAAPSPRPAGQPFAAEGRFGGGALSDGYGTYTTNDPSLRKRALRRR